MPKKIDHPQLLVRRGGANGAVRLAQRHVVPLFAVLDRTFQKTVVYVGIPSSIFAFDHAGQKIVVVFETGTSFDTQRRMCRSVWD